MKHDIYIFGSAVRGEVSFDSDIDVLVIPTDRQCSSCFPSSWSVYSRDTIASYFSQGRLFAWHLYLESKNIFCAEDVPWMSSLGEPAPYQTAMSDISDLRNLLNQSLDEIRKGSPSLVYEVGLIYTALRDVAMSASWLLLKEPSFSRRAPYLLPVAGPMPESLYAEAMTARHSSTRGAPLPLNIEAIAKQLLDFQLDNWVNKIVRLL